MDETEILDVHTSLRRFTRIAGFPEIDWHKLNKWLVISLALVLQLPLVADSLQPKLVCGFG